MTAWLDRVTGHLTMYRLVVVCLLAILAVAIVLSATGQLFFAPLELLASALVLVAASLLANRLLALVFRVRPHWESTLITALLLLFIFRPTIEPAALGVLALSAVIATASKYLLAIRRRHVLNPAAAGAFAVGLLELDVSTWWIATSWLLPFTAVGGFLVLYRTRRLPLGLLFVVLAVVIVTVRMTMSGIDIGGAIGIAFTSYPIVFFAGFMLSEPLTLPPQRWQQLVLAAVVAVLFTVPFGFGPLSSTPEFALIIGNILAFLVGQRRGIRLTFVGSRPLGATSWEFEFRSSHPLHHRPGQFMELTLPHRRPDGRGIRRVFSVASAPTPEGIVRFGLRTAEPVSSFKRALLELNPGSRISATSVGGDFVLPADLSQPILLVAGGIGITPFVSQLEHRRGSGQGRQLVLVYVVSSNDEIAYRDVLESGNWRVVLVSPEPPAILHPHWTWAGPGPLTSALLLEAVPDATARVTLLSGPPGLVHALKRPLRRAGVRHVRTDYFSGY